MYDNGDFVKDLNGQLKKRFTLLPQEHTVLVRQTSRWGQILLLSLVAFGASTVATAWFYKIDEIITVQGRLVPKNGGVEIKSPISGRLEEIYVKNGENIDKGQKIVRFEVSSSKAQKENLIKQINIEQQRLKQQLESIEQRQETVNRNISLTTKILNRLKPLQSKGAISELQILERSNTLESQKDQLNQLETQKNAFINDSRSRISEIEVKLEDVKNRLRNEFIVSPLSGTVFDLKPDNDSYFTDNLEILAKVIPKGSLSANVSISNQDIGFIGKGQQVEVRVDSFPFTQYGQIKGTIKEIGADALPPDNIIRQYHFPVNIELERSNLTTKTGEIIPLQAGMTVSANLKLRERRLIEILSDLFTNKTESIKRLRQS